MKFVNSHKKLMILVPIIIIVLIAIYVFTSLDGNLENANSEQQSTSGSTNDDDTFSSVASGESDNEIEPAALISKQLYNHQPENLRSLRDSYTDSNQLENAQLINKILNQPTVVWLTGPNTQDPNAERDKQTISETSQEALDSNTVPVYQLYALPNRDGCAGYSAGGFQTNEQYVTWLNGLLANTRTKSVFLVEADAIAHMMDEGCLSDEAKRERKALLSLVSGILNEHPMVLAHYLDAGHPEWSQDITEITTLLRESGIQTADGIVGNVSFFTSTDETVKWAEAVVQAIGGRTGAIIDTSRNANGAPPQSAGDERWCNPSGRGLGDAPTTSTNNPLIHAYLWIKTPGESDGSCKGYPNAGELIPSIALELARNAR